MLRDALERFSCVLLLGSFLSSVFVTIAVPFLVYFLMFVSPSSFFFCSLNMIL